MPGQPAAAAAMPGQPAAAAAMPGDRAAAAGAEPVHSGLVPVPGGAMQSGTSLPSVGVRLGATGSVPTQPARRITAAALAEAAAALPRAVGEAATNGRMVTDTEVAAFAPTVTRQARPAPAARTSTDGSGTRAVGGSTARATDRGSGSAAGGRSRQAAGGGSGSAAGAGSGHARKGAVSGRTGKNEAAPKARRTPAETVALAARIKAERPGVTESELATALGISASRWRTVRREAANAEDLRLAA
jgi:hypothetical protein